MHHIVIVDDDEILRETIKDLLVIDGYYVSEAENGAELLAILNNKPCSLIILDVGLKEENGIDLIGDIREITQIPILMLSGHVNVTNKISALEMGADDYIGKPTDLKELLSRIRANIRRYHTVTQESPELQKQQNIKFNKWVIDFDALNVKNKKGKDAGLTVDEFNLLSTLAQSPNSVFSREDLHAQLKGGQFEPGDRSIDIQITRIRKKLGDNPTRPAFIRTIRKAGYQFIAPIERIDL